MNAYHEEPVSFSSSGLRLHGILGRPAQPRAEAPAVVMVHGWSSYRIGPHRLLAQAARRLNAEGAFTLRFDLRGRGDSEGDGEKTSLDDMIWDTIAAIDFLAARTGISDIALVGLCSGANVAIGAALYRTQVHSLALWSTLPFQPEQQAAIRVRRAKHYLREYARKAFRKDTWSRLFHGKINLAGAGRTVLGERNRSADGRNLKDSERNLMREFMEYKGRVLFIAGSEDPEGMAGYNLFNHRCQEKHLDAAFHVVPGATHSFYASEHSEAVINITSLFLFGNDSGQDKA